MTKRLLAALFAVVLILSVAILPAYAESASYSYKLDDSADVLNPQDEEKLSGKISELSEKCQCNIAFVIVKDLSNAPFSFNGTASDYAKCYYNYTYGVNTDGIIVCLVLNDEVGSNNLSIYGTGKCKTRLSNSESQDIRDEAIKKHKPDKNNPNSAKYYEFFESIADGLAKAVPPHLKWYMLPLAFIVAFVLAMLILLFLKKQLKSVEMQRGAVNYVRPGSMNVTAARDSYLYSTVSRTAKPKDSGSSTHTSSGGGTHGGGGRSF